MRVCVCFLVFVCCVMSCVARRCSLFFVCRSSPVGRFRLSFVVLCSVVCVVACCCCCVCGLLLVSGVSVLAVIIAFVLSYLLVACGIKCFFSLSSSSSPSLSLTPPCVDSKHLRVCIQHAPVFAGNTRTCVSTCTRGAGTHGDGLIAYSVTFESTKGWFFQHHTPHTPQQ